MLVVALLLSCERIGLEDYHIARNKKKERKENGIRLTTLVHEY
jgi:hypothetical protein